MSIIDRIHIENFRSIKNIDVRFNKINALIGPNNAGKSNIMKALSIVLGETWPSSRTIDDNDYYDRDRTNRIKIQVMFDVPFEVNGFFGKIYGFCFNCSENDSFFVALDSSESPLKYPNGTILRVSQVMKDEVPLVFVDIDRQSSQQVKGSRWTLYGKILEHLGSKITQEKKDQFFATVLNSFNSEIFDTSPGEDLRYLEEELRQSIKEHTGFNLALELSILDPVDAIKNVRPYFKEGASNSKYDPEEMGAGTQSALAVSIAKAYSVIVKKGVVLAIEEPELHFHPQACRNFYNNLSELSNKGLQVIYTTHSPYFVDISKFESIHIVRKNSSATKIESGSNLLLLRKAPTKIITRFNEGVNQTLFADGVILVEGPDDEIACKAMLERLNFDVYKNNVSVVSCGGVKSIPTIAEILLTLKIKTIALIDEDPGNSKTESVTSALRNSLGNNSIYLQSPNLEGVFQISGKFNPTFALAYFQGYQGNVPQVYSDIVAHLSKNNSP